MNEKIIEILNLCMELNPTKTLQEKTGNKPTVFFTFSGHVNHVDISVHLSGWHVDCYADCYYSISLDNGEGFFSTEDDSQTVKRCTIDDVITDLKKLKEEWRNE